jgi:hypothetical protein
MENSPTKLIPNLGVPLSDGTHRVTLRIKQLIDAATQDKQHTNVKEKVYNKITKGVPAEDDMLYNWHSEACEDPKAPTTLTARKSNLIYQTLRQFPVRPL